SAKPWLVRRRSAERVRAKTDESVATTVRPPRSLRRASSVIFSRAARLGPPSRTRLSQVEWEGGTVRRARRSSSEAPIGCATILRRGIVPMQSNPVRWFEIYVKDMKRAKAFYETVLAIKLDKLPDPGPGVSDMVTFPSQKEGFGATGALVKMNGGPSGG